MALNGQNDVRYQGQTGTYVLVLRITGFDPKATLAV
jgi:hypothetical protein